jgi:hypothetical protein
MTMRSVFPPRWRVSTLGRRASLSLVTRSNAHAMGHEGGVGHQQVLWNNDLHDSVAMPSPPLGSCHLQWDCFVYTTIK